MDYYTEGEFDPDKAADALRATQGQNPTNAKLSVAALSAAALIDIAASLKVLALESSAAITNNYYDIATTAPTDGEGEHAEPVDLTRADAGTRVRHLHLGDFGELTGKSGIDQGEPWVEVYWYENGARGRAWVTVLEAVHPLTIADLDPELDEEGNVVLDPIITGETLDALIGRDPEPPAVSEADDLDADFDGDRHTEATDALAALKARNKAAKKGGKK